MMTDYWEQFGWDSETGKPSKEIIKEIEENIKNFAGLLSKDRAGDKECRI